MNFDRPNALDLRENLGSRIGLRLDLILRHCDPVKELSFHLFPNSPLTKVPHFPAINRRFCRFGVGKILILLMWNPGFSM